MRNILLPVPHLQQRSESDCLAASAEMVLAYWDVHVSYNRLLKLLKVKPFGAAGYNLLHLVNLGVSVSYRESSMADLLSYLENGIPSITLLHTSTLSHWAYATDHAVVVVGSNPNSILIHDPAFLKHPIAVPLAQFELAWMHFDYYIGVITPRIEK